MWDKLTPVEKKLLKVAVTVAAIDIIAITILLVGA